MLVMAVALIPLLSMMIFGIANLMNTLIIIGQEGIVLGLGLAINSVVIFIFGIFYIISSFYFATDVENLLPMPLKPRQIVGAKFLVVMVFEYLITALIFLPVLLIFGIKTGAGPLYYVYGLIVFGFVPVIPLAISSVLVMLMMRFTNVSRNKDIFKIIGGIFAIILGLSFNLILQRFMGGITTGELEQMLVEGNNSLAILSTGLFPTAGWAVQALIHNASASGFLNLLLYVGVSFVVYLGLLVLGELFYFKGVVGISETGSKRHKASSIKLDQTIVKGSQFSTYTRAELRLLFRTPIYFLNCVLINFIWPVFMIFPLFAGSMDVSMIEDVKRYLADPQGFGIILAGAFAASLFFGSSNAVAPTAISREGQMFFVKKYLPISYKTQILAKVGSGFILGAISIIVMVLFAVGFLKMPILLALLILGSAWMGILLTSFTGIVIDLINPKLKWETEQQAVKQNMNVLYNIIIGAGLAALTMFAAFKLSVGLWATLLLLLGVFGALNFLMYRLATTFGVKRFIDLQG